MSDDAINQFDDRSCVRIAEATRRTLDLARPGLAQAKTGKGQSIEWRHGILWGAVRGLLPSPALQGNWGAVLYGGSLTQREWLGVELRHPDPSNPDNLVPDMRGTITAATQAGSNPTSLVITGTYPPVGAYVLIQKTANDGLDGIWQVGPPDGSGNMTLLGTVAKSQGVAPGAIVTLTPPPIGAQANWTLAVPVASRDTTLVGVGGASTYCQVHYGYGEWSLVYRPCPG